MPNGRHRLVPDGCVELLWLTSGPVIVCGPETRSWTFELPAPARAVGVRFRPGTAARVLHLDVSSIRDRRVRWSQLTTSAEEGRLSADVSTAARGPGGLAAGLRVIEEQVRRLAHGSMNDGVADTVLTQLSRPDSPSQSDLAKQLALSPRQLHRRSLRLFGYGTSTLARLLRFQRLLAISAQTGPTIPLVQRALAAGYSDQAHLTRDCQAIAGTTPTRFFGEYFPTFPDMSDPFKTRGAARGLLSA